MIAVVALIMTASPAAFPEPVPDQTADALVVVQTLGSLRAGDIDRALEGLAQTVTFDGQTGSIRDNLGGLASYTGACQLDQISLVNSRTGSRLPVLVEWHCRYPEADRHAAFWFEGDKISRVRWGALPTVELPSPVVR